MEKITNMLEVTGQSEPDREMWLSNSHPAVISVQEVENILRTDRVKVGSK